ncbi:hypothetical protein U9M48_026290 [Paspalum notatum var. saurae]|uniref:Uncharacterized protein n=1 Tax=Paspalum notatum var. saurae TaxID=547442 RepID=A0AAQ3TW56_PASNO
MMICTSPEGPIANVLTLGLDVDAPCSVDANANAQFPEKSEKRPGANRTDLLRTGPEHCRFGVGYGSADFRSGRTPLWSSAFIAFIPTEFLMQKFRHLLPVASNHMPGLLLLVVAAALLLLGLPLLPLASCAWIPVRGGEAGQEGRSFAR